MFWMAVEFKVGRLQSVRKGLMKLVPIVNYDRFCGADIYSV